VISQLDQRYAAEVEDIITSPSEPVPYTTLRTELVRRLSPSIEHLIRELLTLKMGDRKPPQFLRPQKPRPRHASPANLRRLYTAARCLDHIIEAAPQPTVVSVAPPLENNDTRKYVEDLRRQVKALHADLDRVRSNSRAPRSSSWNCRSYSRSPHETLHPPSAGTIADTEPGQPKTGDMLAYLFTDCALASACHFVFSLG
jgi:hypothetical protein